MAKEFISALRSAFAAYGAVDSIAVNEATST